MAKIDAYVGFAKKSRAIVFGTNSIISAGSKCKLIVVSDNLSANAVNKLKNIAPLIMLNSAEHTRLFGSAEAVAITNQNLANAITKNLKAE